MARKHTVRWAVYSVTCVFARLTAPLQTPFSALQVRTSENGGPQMREWKMASIDARNGTCLEVCGTDFHSKTETISINFDCAPFQD